MVRYFKLNLLNIGVALSLCLCVGGAQAESAPTEFGAILPLTGEGASWGLNAQRGIELATAELHAEGHAPKIIIEDSPSGRPETAMRAYRKLKDLDQIKFFLGPINQDEVEAIGPMLGRDRTLAISTTTAEKLPPNMFSIWINPSFLAAELADYVRLSHHRIAILGSDSSWEATMARGIQKRFQEKGGVVTDIVLPPFNTSDLKTVVTKILATKPDAVVITSYYLFPAYISALKTLNFKGARISVELDRSLIDVIGQSGNGILFMGPADPSPDFTARFKERFKAEPDIPAAQFYDATKLLSTAIAATDGSVEQVWRYLTTLSDYRGAGGEYKFEGGRTHTTYSFFQIKDGQILPATKEAKS